MIKFIKVFSCEFYKFLILYEDEVYSWEPEDQFIVQDWILDSDTEWSVERDEAFVYIIGKRGDKALVRDYIEIHRYLR